MALAYFFLEPRILYVASVKAMVLSRSYPSGLPVAFEVQVVSLPIRMSTLVSVLFQSQDSHMGAVTSSHHYQLECQWILLQDVVEFVRVDQKAQVQVGSQCLSAHASA